jgi:alpha-glucoside transport system permease protein
MASITGTQATVKDKRPFPFSTRERLTPWLWVAPAVFFAVVFLVYPVINTLWLSLRNDDSSAFVALKNYALVIAVLVDRVKIEGAAKAAIFIPMAISFVGAGVIWRFVYVSAPKGQPQTGLLDAFITRLGFSPQAWLINSPLNNFALIAVYVWMWTGFCMVILSAALKSVPSEILEAARVDGANELTIFWRVIVPMISPTIVVVATTMIINLLKIFDIVYVMTGGDFGTNVIAMAYYQQDFNFGNTGLASALAVVLLLAVIPIMYFNIRRYRQEIAR